MSSTSSITTKSSHPPSAKKQKKDAPASSPPNFRPEEDVSICKAFVYATLNSEKGADQSAAEFWGEVGHAFRQNMQKVRVDNPSFPHILRMDTPIKNRWINYIQKETQLFIGEWRKIEKKPPSGTTFEKRKEMAAQKFLEIFEHKFKFMHCVDTLKVLPKFDPEMEGEGDKLVNNSSAPIASGMQRPVGQKKAKAAEKYNRMVDNIYENTTAPHVASMAESQKSIAESNEDFTATYKLRTITAFAICYIILC